MSQTLEERLANKIVKHLPQTFGKDLVAKPIQLDYDGDKYIAYYNIGGVRDQVNKSYIKTYLYTHRINLTDLENNPIELIPHQFAEYDGGIITVTYYLFKR